MALTRLYQGEQKYTRTLKTLETKPRKHHQKTETKKTNGKSLLGYDNQDSIIPLRAVRSIKYHYLLRIGMAWRGQI